MIKYLVRRLLALIPILLGVILTTFILSRLIPGDACIALMPPQPVGSAYLEYGSVRARIVN